MTALLVNTVYGSSNSGVGSGSLVEINGLQVEPTTGIIEELEIPTEEVKS
nr:MAG TPA: hypothetical protein [Caudoviricetes sp.]